MKRLLLLIPSTSYRVADILAAAHRLEVEVAVGSDRRQVLEKYSEGRTATFDFRNLQRGVRQITDYAENYSLGAILGTDEETTVLAAMASRALGLRHNTPDSVAASVDKHRFRSTLAAAGIPGPEFALTALEEDATEVARRVRYPCVLKPLALSASRGVIRADDVGEFVAARERIARLLATLGSDAPACTRGHILVEDYVPGREVALEGLLEGAQLGVLALFDKPDALAGPYFEETIYVTPSRLPRRLQEETVSAVAAAVRALGLTDGPIHAEVRIGDGDEPPVVIELAARSIGGLCSRTLRFGAGIRLEEMILRHALGMPRAMLRRESLAAGVMMIPIPRAGTLHAVSGLDHARAVPAIEDVSITIPVGDVVVPLPEGDRYLGFLFARGEEPAAVEAALREAHRGLEFDIEPRVETGPGA